MPILNLKVNTNIDSDLTLSPKNIKDNYLFGVDIKDRNGQEISDDIYEFYIRAAQEELEKFLHVKLTRQIFEETISFNKEEWEHWGFIKTTFPVVCPLELKGFLGTTKQVEYPPNWMTARRSSDDGLWHRSIYIVPVSSGGQTSSIIYSGVIPKLNYFNSTNIPFYWNVSYVTGFERIPNDLLNFIGKLASVNLFHIAGDLILGAGIANQSISIDGLSQSIGTTSSATNAGYGARVIGYLNDLKMQLPILKNYYGGIDFTVA